MALRNIVAYRTGLAIREWPGEEAEAALREFRGAAREGSGRLVHKPLLDTLLRTAFSEAARQEVPVQFHVGYGDADTDLLRGNPLYLCAVLEKTDYRDVPVVLLHECYPYIRQGGYLAAVYENVYPDLSYGIPFLGYGEMLSFTRAALGVAPISKLLYSSDGIGRGAGAPLDGRHRRAARPRSDAGRTGSTWRTAPLAGEAAGEAVLRGNALRLYRLSH